MQAIETQEQWFNTGDYANCKVKPGRDKRVSKAERKQVKALRQARQFKRG